MGNFWGNINQALINTLSDAMEYQERVWIINIRESQLRNDSFVIAEDNFREPMEWMVDRDYPDDVLEDIEALRLSQSISFKHGSAEHSIVRVK